MYEEVNAPLRRKRFLGILWLRGSSCWVKPQACVQRTLPGPGNGNRGWGLSTELKDHVYLARLWVCRASLAVEVTEKGENKFYLGKQSQGTWPGQAVLTCWSEAWTHIPAQSLSPVGLWEPQFSPPSTIFSWMVLCHEQVDVTSEGWPGLKHVAGFLSNPPTPPIPERASLTQGMGVEVILTKWDFGNCFQHRI